MKYTKYFATIEQPKLTNNQFKRYMNIVHLEGKIDGLIKAQKLTPELPQKYQMEIFKTSNKLTELTGNLPAPDLLKQMFNSK